MQVASLMVFLQLQLPHLSRLPSPPGADPPAPSLGASRL